MKAAITLVIVAAAAFGVWKFVPFGSTADAGDDTGVYYVRRQSFPINITESGTLVAQKSTRVRAPTRGKIEWIEEEGTAVKKGDVLVRLDKVDLENEIAKLKDQITQLESDLKTAKTEETIQIGQNNTDLEKAELALAVAKVELEKLQKKDIPLEKRKLELDVEKKKTDLDEAERQLEAKEKLYQEEFVTEIELQQARLLVTTRKNDLETAEQTLASYIKYDIPLETRKKKAAVDEATRGLERATRRAEAELTAKQGKVRQKTVALGRAQVLLKRQEDLLGKMVLTAPTDGTVLYKQGRWGADDNIRVGGQTWPGMVLLQLPDASALDVEIDVHEADIDKLKEKMGVVVTSESKAGSTFMGEVSKIGHVPNAGRRWGGDGIKRFRVLVSLTERNLPLKPGTSARVEIQIDEAVDVIAVPLQAVHAAEGRFYCYRLDDGEPAEVDVKLGRSNDALVEILEGLSEGDRVLLYSPESARSTDNGNGGNGKPASRDDE